MSVIEVKNLKKYFGDNNRIGGNRRSGSTCKLGKDKA